jgi:hypothetical protein
VSADNTANEAGVMSFRLFFDMAHSLGGFFRTHDVNTLEHNPGQPYKTDLNHQGRNDAFD